MESWKQFNSLFQFNYWISRELEILAMGFLVFPSNSVFNNFQIIIISIQLLDIRYEFVFIPCHFVAIWGAHFGAIWNWFLDAFWIPFGGIPRASPLSQNTRNSKGFGAFRGLVSVRFGAHFWHNSGFNFGTNPAPLLGTFGPVSGYGYGQWILAGLLGNPCFRIAK